MTLYNDLRKGIQECTKDEMSASLLTKLQNNEDITSQEILDLIRNVDFLEMLCSYINSGKFSL